MTTVPVVPRLRARWYALAAGMLAQSSVASLQQGLPALAPLLRSTFDLSLPALGALLASVSWGSMMTIYMWGRLADHWGERLVVSLGLGGAAVVLTGMLWTETALQLGFALGLAGALSGSAIAASGRAVMGWFPRSERGLALGLRQMAVPLGAGYAALVLPVAAFRFGVQGAFLALAALALIGMIVALYALGPPPGVAEPAHQKSVAPIRDGAVWRLSSASSLMQWAQVALSAFIVVILVEGQGLPYATAVALFALIQLFSGVTRVAAGWLSDRGGRRVPHLRRHGIALTVGLCLSAAALQTAPSAFTASVIVVVTVMASSWNGLAFASVAEMAGKGQAGAALGLHGTLMRALTLPTALLFGMMAAWAGWSASLAVLALFPLAGVILLTPLAAEEDRRTQLVP